MYIRQNLAVGLVLAISMVGISYGVGGDMGAATEPLTDGSAAYPYLIEDLTDFDVFADSANAATYWSSGVYTKLTCDPNLTGRPYTTAVIAPDTPDTDGYFDGIAFAGVFDGDGHVISNLTIDTIGVSNDYLGLFGRIASSSAEVKNLGLENINITGDTDSDYLGGLCGYNYNGTITNCYATGSVTGGAGSRILGGLCGYNRDTITNCYAAGSVTGGSTLGGLCGLNLFGTISDCHATGSVNGGDNSNTLGGLCGNNNGGATITNCYATGSVTGGDGSGYLGGLCGYDAGGTITNCYATGSVTGGFGSWFLGGLCGHNLYGTITNSYATGSVTGDSDLGGLCGENYYGTITNCFWDVETSGIGIEGDDNYGATGKTTEQMQTESTFTDANWDFTVVPLWHMPFQAIGYPMLGWQKDIPGDFTSRYGVYMDDFAVLSNAWLSVNTPTANWNEHCDLNGNGVIDPGDLKTFAEHWLCK
ncbi:MAG: hypothetical protein KAJ52_08145 [Sedimentisphaerales bacterium]|nr:hypothetical protein [Sedimentisphaerales bacterium]